MIYLFVLVLFVLLVLALYFVISWFSAGPYTPIPMNILDDLLTQIEIEPGSIFVDLGAGDARVLIKVAESKQAICVGYEIHPLVWLVGKIRIFFSSQKRIRLIRGDLFKAKLADADFVFVHLLPHGLTRLKKKLKAGLKSGARVISYGVHLDGFDYKQTLKAKAKPNLARLFPDEAYVYTIA